MGVTTRGEELDQLLVSPRRRGVRKNPCLALRKIAMTLMENTVRSLSEKERRLLNAATALRQRRLDKLHRRMLVIGLLQFLVIWGVMLMATIADKKGPTWYWSMLIALGIALPIALWSYLSLKPKLIADVRNFESALRRNEARVIRIQSDRMVEFEEEEDEGACYAFQLKNYRIVFVAGQEFYPAAKFPNDDFSLISIYGDNDVLVEELIEKHGLRLKPARTISSKQKATMIIPYHLETIAGDLDRIEQLLAKGGVIADA